MRISNVRDSNEAPDENGPQRISYIDYCRHAVSLSEGKRQLIKEDEKGLLKSRYIVHMAQGGDTYSCIGPGTMVVHQWKGTHPLVLDSLSCSGLSLKSGAITYFVNLESYLVGIISFPGLA